MACNLFCVQTIRNNIKYFVIELFLNIYKCVRIYIFPLIKVNENFIVIIID